MTKIKSHFGKTLTISEWKMSPGKVAFECEANDDGTGEHARLYDRTELHAALGIDELGCGCDEADTNLKKALARAEEAEAKLAEAEATIERVREIAENSYNSSWLALKGIRDALDPKPAFELPTEAGVRFTAHRVGGLKGQRSTFTTMADGLGRAFYFAEPEPDDYMEKLTDHLWEPDRMLTDWTDHRLLDGAE